MIRWYHIFVLDKEKEKPDAKVRFRVKWGKDIVAFNVGYRVEISKWNPDTQRVKNNTTHGAKKIPASVINREIGRFETAVDELIARYERDRKVPTKDQFRKAFKELIGGKDPDAMSFFDVIEKFKKEEGSLHGWSHATIQKVDTMKKHLSAFNPDLTFSDLDEHGMSDFVSYLRSSDLRNTTILKMVSMLKWFMRYAVRIGATDNHAFEHFSSHLKTPEKVVIFLEWGELMRMYRFEFPESKKHLETARDMFCFQCFTSLRYSDLYNLKKSDLYDDCIKITTIKTADTIQIDLNDYSRAILDKYRDIEYPLGRALPVQSNQKMNDYIKQVAYLCGIDKPVSYTYYKGGDRITETKPKYELIGTHAGRRTFICNALMLGIPPDIVMKWTGHSDYKAMKPYIDIADQARKDAMNLFNKR